MIELFGENKPLPVTKMPFPNGLSYQFIVTGNNIWKQETGKQEKMFGAGQKSKLK